MNDDEADDIRRYKELSRRLPIVETLAGLWVADFDQEAYPNLDEFDALSKYLDELKPYAELLVEASNARQYHFQRWLDRENLEDQQHKHWREGMNAIAEDAREKYKYWLDVHDKMFDRIIAASQKRQRVLPRIDLTMYNVEYDYVNITSDKNKDKLTSGGTISRPKLSEKEKAKRKRELKALRMRKKKEDEKLLESAIKEQDISYRETRSVSGIKTAVNPDLIVDMNNIQPEIQIMAFVTEYRTIQTIGNLNDTLAMLIRFQNYYNALDPKIGTNFVLLPVYHNTIQIMKNPNTQDAMLYLEIENMRMRDYATSRFDMATDYTSMFMVCCALQYYSDDILFNKLSSILKDFDQESEIVTFIRIEILRIYLISRYVVRTYDLIYLLTADDGYLRYGMRNHSNFYKKTLENPKITYKYSKKFPRLIISSYHSETWQYYKRLFDERLKKLG